MIPRGPENMIKSKALIIFQKNYIAGKVKTRLAKDIGDDKALAIFKDLVKATWSQIPHDLLDIHVFYSDFVDQNKMSKDYAYIKSHVQKGVELGERMIHAFRKILEKKKYSEALIIGTDCPFIRTDIYARALGLLAKNDYVLGPAKDGGYYLLGSKIVPTTIMGNINWSSPSVLDETVHAIQGENKTFALLEILPDIDTVEDVRNYWPPANYSR